MEEIEGGLVADAMTESFREACGEHQECLLSSLCWGRVEDTEILQVHEYDVLVDRLGHRVDCHFQIPCQKIELSVRSISILDCIVKHNYLSLLLISATQLNLAGGRLPFVLSKKIRARRSLKPLVRIPLGTPLQSGYQHTRRLLHIELARDEKVVQNRISAEVAYVLLLSVLRAIPHEHVSQAI